MKEMEHEQNLRPRNEFQSEFLERYFHAAGIVGKPTIEQLAEAMSQMYRHERDAWWQMRDSGRSAG